MPKFAVVLPGNGTYFASSKKINGRIHPFRKNIYERINKLGYLCEYIGMDNLEPEILKEYHCLVLLNVEKLNSIQKGYLKSYLKNGGNLVMTYKTVFAREFAIRITGKLYPQDISLKQKNINYSILNIDSFIYKLNRKFLKSVLSLNNFCQVPALIVKPGERNKVLAKWHKEQAPCLITNTSFKGTMVYFSGILSGTENRFLEYILSLIKAQGFKPLALIPNKKKCCVSIFHDYEGEFSNRRARRYTEYGLNRILELEKKYGVKATFNILGKIGEKYPDYIKRIIKDGHEIASHTYAHQVPQTTDYRRLDKSIQMTTDLFKQKFNVEIKGFRSPESKWSPALIEILRQKAYLWNAEDEEASLPYNLVLHKGLKIIRIAVTSDDYLYISRNLPAERMLKKLKEIIYKGIKENNFVVIGFHPWIEGMNEERLKAFGQFVKFLSSNQELKIMTLSEICHWWQNRKERASDE